MEKQKNKDNTDKMTKVSQYIRKYWYLYTIGTAALILQVSFDMISPKITQSIIDDVIGDGKSELLSPLLIALLCMGVVKAFCEYIKNITFDGTSSKISVGVRGSLFRHIQTLSMDFFDRINSGELMSRVKDDCDRIWDGLNFVGMLIIEVTVRTVIIIYCMLKLSPKLSVIPLVAMPIVAGFAVLLEVKLGGVYGEISDENAKLNDVAQENLSGVRTVKAFAREKYEIEKFLSHNKTYYDLNMKQSILFIKIQPVFEWLTKMLPIGVIIYGGYITMHGGLTIGELAAFVEYSNNIVWPMEMLGWLLNAFSSAFASNSKIRKIYAQKSSIKEADNPVHIDPKKAQGHIEFDHVSFSLDGREILHDISFDLKPGETIGIMGETGAGKSTIISLLKRFYDVSQGEIRFDGVDIRKIYIEDLRRSISLVMQDVFLFSDTIKSNVKLGAKNFLNDENVRYAIMRAQADGFVENMSEQYDTMIGERGVGLSGGQKQRISMARAFAKKEPVLVMDDSTSALDMETEQEVEKNIDELKGTSKIIIAHRISAVRSADEIVILSDGSIVERGTHDTLLAAKGMYYETYIAQYGKQGYELYEKTRAANAKGVMELNVSLT